MSMYFDFDLRDRPLLCAPSSSPDSSMKSYSLSAPFSPRFRLSSASAASVEDDLKERKKSSKAAVHWVSQSVVLMAPIGVYYLAALHS